MERGNLSRRGFLARSLGGLTAAGLPLWYAKETLADLQDKDSKEKKVGPNDRITMAAIGTGTNRTRKAPRDPMRGERGVHIMQDAMGQQGVQMVAVCDVDRPNAEFARDIVRNARQGGSRDCRVYTDFRELLQNRDIDAVTIGTPDHWHALVAIAAMRAGKDVYCEKPLTLTLSEGQAMVRTARATNKIVQTGSQQRSDALFRLACEMARNSRLGRVQRITTVIGSNPAGGPFAAEDVPEGLDWNFWLGPTARVDYVKQRCHYDFRWWYDYSGGKMTDWGAHHNDIAQWALGMDESGPISVRGTGTAPRNEANCFNCHPEFQVTFGYQGGAQVICRSQPPREGWTHPNNGVLIEGEDGKWIFVNRGSIAANDGDRRTSRILNDELREGAVRLPVSNNHMGNFIECLRSRRQPICNVVVGHRSCSVCHLGNIAVRFFNDQQLTWNPRDERFEGERAEAANRHLTRTMRDPWRIEAGNS